MADFTDSEKILYQIIAVLEDSGFPLVYKGAMVTKLILHENNFDHFIRETLDIDASWVDTHLLTIY
jgi:hypothetical protein